MNKLDELALLLTKEVTTFLYNWMALEKADSIMIHKYRMRLFKIVTKEGQGNSERLIRICRETGARCTFDVREITGDKILGDSIASYIIAKLISGLNTEYLRLLNKEIDFAESENEVLSNRTSNLSRKLDYQ